MSAAELTDSLLSLPVADRIALADHLYASVPADWQAEADRAWLLEAERRSAEMDADPSVEMSFDDFKAGIESSRKA